jgi:hypothetical protein
VTVTLWNDDYSAEQIVLTHSHSVMMWSAHSTNPTKIVGLPNFASHVFKSASVTPRAREQAPQANTGMCLALILSHFGRRGPSHCEDGFCRHVAHQVGGFTGREDLDLVPSIG